MGTIRLTPVIEVAPLDGVAPWPVAARAPYTLLPLHGGCGDDETGLFVALLSDAHGVAPDRLAAEETLIAQGGLRLSAGDVTIDPGCCAGLESWRDWAAALHGERPWLGHGPSVSAEARGAGRLRVRQDADDPGSAHIDLPLDALPGLLADVRQDLIGFLATVRVWAARHGLAPDPLAATLDRSFTITAPLDLRRP